MRQKYVKCLRTAGGDRERKDLIFITELYIKKRGILKCPVFVHITQQSHLKIDSI